MRPTYGTTQAELANIQAEWNGHRDSLIEVYDIMLSHLETIWGTAMPKSKYYMERADHEVLLSYDPDNDDDQFFAENKTPKLFTRTRYFSRLTQIAGIRAIFSGKGQSFCRTDTEVARLRIIRLFYLSKGCHSRGHHEKWRRLVVCSRSMQA